MWLRVLTIHPYHSHERLGIRTHIWSRIWTIDLKKKYGEWVVITGATDGIGLEYAREFARRGHSLVLVGRNETKLTRVKQELSRLLNPSKIVTVIADFNTADSDVSVKTTSSSWPEILGISDINWYISHQ